MQKRTYIVLNAFSIGTGSHTQHPTPKKYITIPEGEIVTFDSRAPDGTMWFIYKGERGKVETNLTINQYVERGRLEPCILI